MKGCALFLLALLLSCSAHAGLPFLEDQDFGTTPVEVKKGTVTISGGSLSITGVVTTDGSYDILTLTVAVAGGTGFTTFSSTGTLLNCSITPPGVATYDFEILTNDADAFAVFGRGGISGKAGLMGPRLIAGPHRATFSNASLDGSYRSRCVVKK